MSVLRRYGAHVLIAAISLAIFAPLIGFLPVFDGNLYYHCLKRGIDLPFSLWNFDCYNHPTMLYMLLVGLSQYLMPNNIVALNGMFLLQGIAAAWCFHSVVGKLGRFDRTEQLLATLSLVVYPVAWAAAVNINPDYGSYVWAIIFLATVVYERRILAILAGTVLVLSKEPGIMAYVAITLSYLLVYQLDWRRGRLWPHRSMSTLAKNWHLVVPSLAVVVYFVAKSRVSQTLLWSESSGGTSNSKLLELMASFDFSNKTMQAYLFIMFVMNFTWVITLLLLAFGCLQLGRKVFKGHERSHVAPDLRKLISFSALAAVVLLYFLTRFMTFINARYFLVFYPFLLLLFAAAMRFVIHAQWVRNSIYTAIIGLGVGSLYRTVDPITRKFFGTFPVGQHDLLDMTSYTHECCGRGRDQLLYNLEFTRLFTIQEKAFARFAATPDTKFVVANRYYTLEQPYYFNPTLKKLELAPSTPASFIPNISRADSVTQGQPAEFLYLNFPNYDNEADRSSFAAEYDLTEEVPVNYGTYRMTFHRFKIKTRGS